MNFTWLCGPEDLVVWDKSENILSHCFFSLALFIPAHVILLLTSAYFCGYLFHGRNLKSKFDLIHLRLIFACLLFLCPLVLLIASYRLNVKQKNIDQVCIVIVAITWLFHIYFLKLLKVRYLNSTQGPCFPILSMFLLCCINSYNVYRLLKQSTSSSSSEFDLVTKCISCVVLTLQVFYVISSLPRCSRRVVLEGVWQINGDDSEDLQHSSLLRSQFPSYGSFEEDRIDLGVAEQASCISKSFFCWASGLLQKGIVNQLSSVGDLFELPEPIQSRALHSSFAQARKTPIPKHEARKCDKGCRCKKSLLSVLTKCFGLEYFSIGLLKFIADVLSFTGPVLLNYLVDFIESGNGQTNYGYYYAAALCLTTLFGAFCSSHFNYLTTRVGLKIRGALMSAVYAKTLAVNSTVLSKFSSGKITNFFSTDTDCVVNFCPSFHQFWSLPLQMSVTLYLLHQQLGLAFLTGVGFAVVIIPLNQWIAKKIGALSKVLMACKDERIKLMNEVLRGIRVIKMHSWEDSFHQKIVNLRRSEMKPLKTRKYLDALCVYFWATTPVLVSLLTFSTYVLLGNKLTAAKVFTSIALFNMLLMPLNAFPWVINGLMEAWVSLKRLETFLSLVEQSPKNYYVEVQGEAFSFFRTSSFLDLITPLTILEVQPCNQTNIIEVESAIFSWNPDVDEKLDDIHRSLPNLLSEISGDVRFLGPLTFRIREGQLVGVIGSVGSGKSSLISALTAELELLSGTVAVRTHDFQVGIGLVMQEPWVQHATIRDNIVFGSQFCSSRYEQVLECCALLEDIQNFPMGDRTEVGDSGVTLSGGQKARLTLARAVYQDFNIYLLDDPFSAVDVHVAQHIFQECILGMLKYKTRIICTHHTHLLEDTDIIISMENGTIQSIGPPSHFFHEQNNAKINNSALSELNGDVSCMPIKKDSLIYINQQSEDENEYLQYQYKNEEREVGSVKFWVYKGYCKAAGIVVSISVLLALLCMQDFLDRVLSLYLENTILASRTLSDWWLAHWSSEVHNTSTGTEVSVLITGNNRTWFDNARNLDSNLLFYLGVLSGIAVLNTIFTFARAFLFAYGGIKAAVNIHNKLLASVMEGAVGFFDTTPLGRIINRFSTDVYTIDDSLPFTMNILLAQFYSLMGALAITCFGLPWITLLVLLLGPIYLAIQEYYRKTSRELKRLCALSLSPVYSFFQETLNGLATIRAFGSVFWFCSDSFEKLDNNQKAMLSTSVVAQWLNLRLQLIGVVIVTGVALVAVLEHDFGSVDPGMVGLALSYALTVTSLMNGLVTYFTETEKEMISVERAMQYIDNIPKEKSHYTLETPFGWPTHGVISFRNVYLRYHEGGPLALINVSFDTKPFEKIGILGRTGSGKSSLVRVIFRLSEMESGEVFIDGVNIALLSLKSLRSRISVIPQDPFVFSSSVRENLDPHDNFSDDELWKALEECYLRSAVLRIGGLDAEIGEKGRELSVGQRQLLCLARALLTKAKVLCLDEATASIDKETDQLIQATIRRAFSHTTILTIAHRLETVLDSDRILVMSKGSVVEFDKPSSLLNDKSSALYSMMHKSDAAEKYLDSENILQ